MNLRTGEDCGGFADGTRKYPEKVMRRLLSTFCERDNRVVDKESRRTLLLLESDETNREIVARLLSVSA